MAAALVALTGIMRPRLWSATKQAGPPTCVPATASPPPQIRDSAQDVGNSAKQEIKKVRREAICGDG